ncbi:MAG TPA: O-antigen ligase family protein [Bacteroidetes bacterium]|nr:O-antigen ligase family protein [Bacteroidota bacterium]HEX03529.1 O-antigen ligase family protein [Bacteroidota bacterium]
MQSNFNQPAYYDEAYRQSMARKTSPIVQKNRLLIWIVTTMFVVTMSIIILMSNVLLAIFPSINSFNGYLGMLLSVTFIAASIYYKRYPQAELVLVGLWLAWSLTGFAVAYNINHFVSEYTTALQVWVFGLIAFGVASIREDLKANILSYVPALSFVLLYGLITGEFQSALSGEETRVYSITTSPNTIAQQTIPFIGFLVYMFKETKKPQIRTALIALMIFAGTTIIFTGSRKGMLGLGLAISLYYIFQIMRKGKRKRLKDFLLFTLLMMVVLTLIPIILNETLAGKRLQEFMTDPLSEQKRINMYLDGWQMFLDNPIFGVGLGNYRLLSPYQSAAHSDYMEILTGTGIIGFVLYFSMYFVGLARLLRVRKLPLSNNEHHHIRMLLALFIVEVVLNFGRSVYISPYHSFVLMTYFGYAYGLECKIKRMKIMGLV